MALERGMTEVDAGFLRKTLPATLRRFDKGGDNYYDQISAMHKSVRGSDPDAALYWMCRMLDGGCDPRYIARRVVRMAIEDISLADPRATQLAVEAAEIYERLGSPEGACHRAGCRLSCLRTQEQRRLQRLQRSAGLREDGPHASRPHVFAKRAYEAHEGARIP